MGLFNSGGAAGTIGAGKSGATTTKRFGPDSPIFWVGGIIVLGLLCPPMVLTFFVVMGISQARRVRPSRLWAFAGVLWVLAFVFAAVVAGNASAVFGWLFEGVMVTWGDIGTMWFDAAGQVSMVASTFWNAMLAVLGMMAVFGIPAGATWGAAYASFMKVRRVALADVEGFAWPRPVGFLDRRRERKNRAAIVSGAFTTEPVLNRKGEQKESGTVALGLGEYGYPIVMRTDDLLQATLFLGAPGTGKTAGASSIDKQNVALGSGLGLIDMKGDQHLPLMCAQLAEAHGRRFLHFTLADKNGAPYEAPHPSAPATKAYYDPLTRGNATSKADMLLNSVGRDGDAAAYFRRAYDLVQIAYRVAALTGYDRNPDGTRKPGLVVLRDLLDLDRLRKLTEQWKDLDGSAWAAEHPDEEVRPGRSFKAVYPDLDATIDDMVSKARKDNVLAGAIADTASLISTFVNGPAIDGRLRPAPLAPLPADGTGPDPADEAAVKAWNDARIAEAEARTINLVRAAKEGDIVLFTLSVQDYGDLARTIGTLVLLDIQNAANELRAEQERLQRTSGDKDAKVLAHPFYVQIEEFSALAADAVLGVLNKSRDVNIRPILSTQSWSDIVVVDGTGHFANQVLDQCGNFLIYGVNHGETAEMLAALSGKVTKKRPRESKEYSAGLFGMGLKAANLGKIETTAEEETRVPSEALQGLPKFHCVWIAKHPTLSAAHTFDEGANHWWEMVQVVLVPPTVLSKIATEDVDHGTQQEPEADPGMVVVDPDSDPTAPAGPEEPTLVLPENRVQIEAMEDPWSTPATSTRGTATATLPPAATKATATPERTGPSPSDTTTPDQQDTATPSASITPRVNRPRAPRRDPRP